MPFGIAQAGNIKKPFHKSLFSAKIKNNGFLTCNCFDKSSLDIDFAAALQSSGKLPGTPTATMQPVETNVITVVLENVARAIGAKDTDLAVVMIFEPIKKYVASFTSAGKMADGLAHIFLPDTPGKKKLYGYICFINEAVLAGKLKSENISDRSFCGVVDIGG
jgi:hypothetical protein